MPRPFQFSHPGIVPGALLGWSLAVAGLSFGGPQPVRGALVLSFGLLGPGLALGRLLGLRDLTALLAVACALSLAVGTLGALLMVYAGIWSPTGLYLLLSAGVAAVSARELVHLRPRASFRPEGR